MSMGHNKIKAGFYATWARLFNLGNVGRAVYTKPLGPRSNPLTDIRGNGGHFVERTMYSLKPSVDLSGNTLVLNSVAGIASTVFFVGAASSPLYDPDNAGLPPGFLTNGNIP